MFARGHGPAASAPSRGDVVQNNSERHTNDSTSSDDQIGPTAPPPWCPSACCSAAPTCALMCPSAWPACACPCRKAVQWWRRCGTGLTACGAEQALGCWMLMQVHRAEPTLRRRNGRIHRLANLPRTHRHTRALGTPPSRPVGTPQAQADTEPAELKGGRRCAIGQTQKRKSPSRWTGF